MVVSRSVWMEQWRRELQDSGSGELGSPTVSGALTKRSHISMMTAIGIKAFRVVCI
jgi:hypothetical protein